MAHELLRQVALILGAGWSKGANARDAAGRIVPLHPFASPDKSGLNAREMFEISTNPAAIIAGVTTGSSESGARIVPPCATAPPLNTGPVVAVSNETAHQSISKGNRNCLGAARLVCMADQRPSQSGWAASREANVAAQRFWYGPREKASALWTQRTLRSELVQSYRSAKRQEKRELRPCMI